MSRVRITATALGILMTAAVALTACGDNDNQSSQGNNVQQETAEIQSQDTAEVQQDTIVWDRVATGKAIGSYQQDTAEVQQDTIVWDRVATGKAIGSYQQDTVEDAQGSVGSKLDEGEGSFQSESVPEVLKGETPIISNADLMNAIGKFEGQIAIKHLNGVLFKVEFFYLDGMMEVQLLDGKVAFVSRFRSGGLLWNEYYVSYGDVRSWKHYDCLGLQVEREHSPEYCD